MGKRSFRYLGLVKKRNLEQVETALSAISGNYAGAFTAPFNAEGDEKDATFYGCDWAMTRAEFLQIKQALEGANVKWFRKDKVEEGGDNPAVTRLQGLLDREKIKKRVSLEDKEALEERRGQ